MGERDDKLDEATQNLIESFSKNSQTEPYTDDEPATTIFWSHMERALTEKEEAFIRYMLNNQLDGAEEQQ